MPGKVSTTRNSTAPRVPRKSSVPAINSKTAVVAPDEGPTTELRTGICFIFADAQKTTAGHRKLVVNLRKIQEACCYEPTKPGKKGWDDFDEADFNVEIARCVIRLVSVKKSEAVGDKMIKFLGLFLRHASDKDAALLPQEEAEVEEDQQAFPETPSTRLTSHVLSLLLPLLTSKEKTVRYRATQIISHIVNSFDVIDDESFHLLRTGLLKRIRDKESSVRVQAVLGLGRLAGNEEDMDVDDDNGDSEDGFGMLEKLLVLLRNDPSADVRRSLLLNLPLTPTTLPYLLERARDLDAATRRALYSRLLPALGDFRHLSLSMREKLLRWGLRDRDENVRKATAKLFRERWIEDCVGTKDSAEKHIPEQISPPSIDALLELLDRIDVVNSGVENGVALEALKEFWDGRPDYRDAVSFRDPFWDHLSAESVFLARSFNDFCRQQSSSNYESLLEEKMPVVMKLAFVLQQYTNDLISRLRSITASGVTEEEQDTVEHEFIVEQLLHIAKTLDYTDEIGRRKMFALLRETLAMPELPEEITKLVVEALRMVCGEKSSGEREFCGVVLEAVAEVHDTIAGEEVPDTDDSFHSAVSELTDSTAGKERKRKKPVEETLEDDEEKAIKELMVNMKCLHIAQCMLQNVGDNLQDSVHLVTMLNNLIVPAVRSHEAPIRERGLLCLGLCCLLDKKLSEENLTVFIHCFTKGHDVLQTTALQILSDTLSTHPSLLSAVDADPALQKSVFKVFSKGLKAAHAPDVQSTATIALCKLMLTATISDEDLLKQLVCCFFEPMTKDNAAVRQALTYFLPVYCHSRRDNMERMGRVVPGVLHTLFALEEGLDEEEMVGMSVVANMLAEWTDARKLVVQDADSVTWDEAGRKEVRAVNGDIHLHLAEDLLERIMAHGCSREEKKLFISVLGKLYITSNSSADVLQSALGLITEATDLKVAPDAPSRNALGKLHTSLSKAVGEVDSSDARNQKSRIAEGPTLLPPEKATVLDVGIDVKMEGIGLTGGEGETKVEDSLLEELLNEEI